LKENAKGIKAMMSKFSRDEQYQIMQSMKPRIPMKQNVTISELRSMNASSVMRTFKTLNITFMKEFMKQYENDIKKIISRFSKAEQKDIRMIIDKRIKQKRPHDGHIGFNKTMNRNESFPDINTNMTSAELSKIFSKMGREKFENFTANLDENTQWELYQILNGTKFGDFLEDLVYDDYDEEENEWGDIFGDSDEWGRRKKREIELQKRKKRQTEMGQGMMGDDMEEMSRGERFAFMASRGLQGMMMMDKFDTRNMPRFLSEIPSCLKQIIWSMDDSNEGFLCSKLPMHFKEKIREILMMILKNDIPTSLFEIEWEEIGDRIDRAGFFKKVAKVAMSKAMLPIEVSDVKDIMSPINNMWKEVERNETSSKNKRILKLVSALINALNADDVQENIADIARSVQEMVIMKKGMALLTGVPGPAPESKTFCQLYARYALESSMKGGKRARLEMPTAWLEKEGVIYKGEMCPLTKKWFWTSVARCSCPRDMCHGGDLKARGKF